MIEITQASIEDIPAVKIVDELSFSDDSYPTFVLRQFVDISSKYFLLAKNNNEVIGYVIGNLIKESNIGWVLSLGVHPKARGKNIGSTLTKALIDLIDESNCDGIYLTVHPNNVSAVRIYEKLGFKVIEKVSNYYLDNGDRLLMGRDGLRCEV